VWGYPLIRRKRIDAHRRVMKTVRHLWPFLVCYLVYHAQVGLYASKDRRSARIFQHSGNAHGAGCHGSGVGHYHAAPGVGAARYDQHRKIARWTPPIWLYVSVTGVGLPGYALITSEAGPGVSAASLSKCKPDCLRTPGLRSCSQVSKPVKTAGV
jgi:uncharacterized membrane protein YozB (DUF420 family)